MGMLLAPSNTQAEADQSSFSPQNEQSGDRCSPIMLMACTSPQPSVFTLQLSGRKLSPATGVGSASLRVWPGAHALRNSPRPRTSGSLVGKQLNSLLLRADNTGACSPRALRSFQWGRVPLALGGNLPLPVPASFPHSWTSAPQDLLSNHLLAFEALPPHWLLEELCLRQ